MSMADFTAIGLQAKELLEVSEASELDFERSSLYEEMIKVFMGRLTPGVRIFVDAQKEWRDAWYSPLGVIVMEVPPIEGEAGEVMLKALLAHEAGHAEMGRYGVKSPPGPKALTELLIESEATIRGIKYIRAWGVDPQWYAQIVVSRALENLEYRVKEELPLAPALEKRILRARRGLEEFLGGT